MIYRALLRLYPRAIRDQFACEMAEVHRLTAARFRSAGIIPYAGFQIREVAGITADLLKVVLFNKEKRTMKHLKWTIAGLIAGALTAAFTVGFDFEDQYRSNAVISVSPGVIAPPFANTRSIEMEQIRQRFVVNTLSVPVLVSMIQSHKLHQALWKRVPMQELVEKVRKDVRILPGSSEAIRISFMYPERKVAQDFVVDLIHRMISQDRMFRKQSLSAIIGFLRSETENARADWVKAENDARASESNGRPDSRLMLDVELARDRYRNGRNQIAEAERSLALEERKIGPALELVDPASLPVYPEKGPLLGLVTGGGVGGLAGLLASWAAGFLHRKPDEAIA